VVARWLHAASRRSGKAFVTVNIGGLAEQVFESELFGHVKGAFTDAKSDRVGRFELADGGTLFLDEIANLPTGLQGKLLRVLQSGEFERVGSSRSQRADVRVLSATNADLGTEVTEGRFREDLVFRLNTVEIRVPPLRDRREDIPLLAAHFLSRHVERYRKQLNGFDPAAMRTMLEHTWPGNVRELDHVIERAVLMADGDAVRVSDLGMDRGRTGAPSFDEMTLDDAERELIRRALSRCGGNVTEAAKLLGVSRSALYRRMQRHGL
jgi:DNA-binding NtrC family response regulator